MNLYLPRIGEAEMSDYHKSTLITIARSWPLEHLNGYIEQLETQVRDIRELVRELKALQREKQKARDKKLRDNGPRGAA